MRTARHSVIVLGFLLLIGCSSTSFTPRVDTAVLETQAQAAANRGDLEGAAAIYRRLADATSGDARNGYLLDLARVQVDLGQPETALTTSQGIVQPTAAHSAEAAAVRASAFFTLGRMVDAVRALVEREIWLDSSAAILENQNLIWDGLAGPGVLPPVGSSTGDRVVDGWLALAPLARMDEQDSAFLPELFEWQSEFTGHPAGGGLLRELLRARRGPGARPARIALLLPLSLPNYRQPALAIRDGFLAAHLESGFADQSEIKLYDTGPSGAVASYQQAQIDGADFIVGPLIASEVQRVQEQAGFVPTLALNVIASSTPEPSGGIAAPNALTQGAPEPGTGSRVGAGARPSSATPGAGNQSGLARGAGGPSAEGPAAAPRSAATRSSSTPMAAQLGLYQFALSTDDELNAIADRAIASGHDTAVVLHEISPLGFRVRDDFIEAFRARGGRVVNAAGYVSASPNHESEIKSVLGITLSEQRYQRLRANLNRDIQFEPRRRTDIDMILLQADPNEQGRVIVPQLCLYEAGGIATYAVSGNPTMPGGGPALESVAFPDLPMVIEPSRYAAAEALGEQSLDRVQRQIRLYAFGFDAYGLIERLYAADTLRWPMPGATGDIYLDETGRLRRRLPFAEFREGQARAASASVGLNCTG